MNKQITEFYVSFETAKLLKEKGFPQEYDEYHALVYNEKNYEDEYEVQRMVLETRQVKAGILHSYPLGVPEPKCYCPSQSLALKWLREVHNQIIIIKYGNVGFVEESILQWWWELLNTKGELHACNIVDGNKSYEEACEDSILYVLKNLI